MVHVCRPTSFAFWALWVLATGFGGSVHVLLNQYTTIREWAVVPFIGVLVGAAQAGVLHLHGIGQHWGYKESLKWWLASACGWIVAIMVFALILIPPILLLTTIRLYTNADMSLAIRGAIVSTVRFISVTVAAGVFGIAQWWVLRRHIPSADWWIPISSLAWIFSEHLGRFVSDSIPYKMIDYGGYSQASYAVNPSVVSIAATSLMFGIITSSGLLWLLRRPRKSLSLDRLLRLVLDGRRT